MAKSKKKRVRMNPTRRRIKEALGILKELDVPRGQQNERSALTLLALLGMTPDRSWAEAHDPMLGITEMMEYFKEHFRKTYAPNSRETIRRFTIHQFVQMGLVIANPDDPSRPVNSPDNRYRIDPKLLAIARRHGSATWVTILEDFVASSDGLKTLRPRGRDMPKIPVVFPDGNEVELTAGGQNVLIKQVVEEFCPLFTPGGVVVYLGDTGQKHLRFDAGYFKKLGLTFDEHGKMPDIVVYLPEKKWLVLIEAVTSHGPVNLKRHNELKVLFKNSRAGLVFVTAFLNRKGMLKYIGEISWETEVWVADAPTHMIHFNGERFLGPHPVDAN
jgi:adenine-specific DNA-methyltransferase